MRNILLICLVVLGVCSLMELIANIIFCILYNKILKEKYYIETIVKELEKSVKSVKYEYGCLYVIRKGVLNKDIIEFLKNIFFENRKKIIKSLFVFSDGEWVLKKNIYLIHLLHLKKSIISSVILDGVSRRLMNYELEVLNHIYKEINNEIDNIIR